MYTERVKITSEIEGRNMIFLFSISYTLLQKWKFLPLEFFQCLLVYVYCAKKLSQTPT
jgi:hypothetical protein